MSVSNILFPWIICVFLNNDSNMLFGRYFKKADDTWKYSQQLWSNDIPGFITDTKKIYLVRNKIWALNFKQTEGCFWYFLLRTTNRVCVEKCGRSNPEASFFFCFKEHTPPLSFSSPSLTHSHYHTCTPSFSFFLKHKKSTFLFHLPGALTENV